MNTKSVDVLNFFLIWISFAISYFFPFEVFLFSFAILGPLHYLTEINWLNKQQFFIPDKKEKNLFLIMAICVAFVMTATFVIQQFFGFTFIKQNLPEGFFFGFIKLINKSYFLLFFAFLVPIIFQISQKWLVRCLIFIGSVFLFQFVSNNFLIISLVNYFLPTIIHVCLFTFIFLLTGALKTKNFIGKINVISFLLVLIVILLLNESFIHPNISLNAKEIFNQTSFKHLIIRIVNFANVNQSLVFNFNSIIIYKVQIFLAFIYTYHYLNWFSKVSVIKWNDFAFKRFLVIVVIWIFSIVIYFYDYKLGFILLYFFSLIHVILEFPLNIITINSLLSFNQKILN